jgi:hypothetical protein
MLHRVWRLSEAPLPPVRGGLAATGPLSAILKLSQVRSGSISTKSGAGQADISIWLSPCGPWGC